MADWCCDIAARCRRHGYEVKHRSGCPGAEVDRLRARVAKLEAVAEAALRYAVSPERGRAGGWALRLELSKALEGAGFDLTEGRLREGFAQLAHRSMHPTGACTCGGEGRCEWCTTHCDECGSSLPCALHSRCRHCGQAGHDDTGLRPGPMCTLDAERG